MKNKILDGNAPRPDRRKLKKLSKKNLQYIISLFGKPRLTVTSSLYDKTIDGVDILKRNKTGWKGNVNTDIKVSYEILSF